MYTHTNPAGKRIRIRICLAVDGRTDRIPCPSTAASSSRKRASKQWCSQPSKARSQTTVLHRQRRLL